MVKMIVFDMDGTIADLYGVEGWLECLMVKDVKPYRDAKPIYDMDVLNTVLEMLKADGWVIAVTSWLAKNSNNEYDEAVKEVKKAWLNRMDFPYDILNIVSYGVDKSSVTKDFGGFQILIDDEDKNLNDWSNGRSIDAKGNIIEELIKLIEEER